MKQYIPLELKNEKEGIAIIPTGFNAIEIKNLYGTDEIIKKINSCSISIKMINDHIHYQKKYTNKIIFFIDGIDDKPRIIKITGSYAYVTLHLNIDNNLKDEFKDVVFKLQYIPSKVLLEH